MDYLILFVSLFIKIILLLLVVALAAPFVLKGPDGLPLMTLADIQNPDGLQNVIESISTAAGFNQDQQKEQPASTAGTRATNVYSWRDKQGNVHYSNIQPDDVQALEMIQVNPDANVIKLDKPEESDTSENILPTSVDGQDYIQVYSPEGVNKLIEDTKGIEKEVHKRYQKIDR